jgi:hypothetical protein
MQYQWYQIIWKNKRPILMDAFGLNQSAPTKIELEQPRQVAARCLWVADDGETVVIPRQTIHRCIVEAGRFFKVKSARGRLWTTATASMLPGIIDWGDTEGFPLVYDTWEVDVQAARVAMGGRTPKYRPIFYRCHFEFEIGIDVDEIHPDQFRDIVESAGRRIGIGCQRVELKGLNGVFMVDSWDQIEGPTQDALKCQGLLERFAAYEAEKDRLKEERAAKRKKKAA